MALIIGSHSMMMDDKEQKGAEVDAGQLLDVIP